MKVLIVEGNNKKTRSERGDVGILTYHSLFGNLLKRLDPSIQIEFAFPTEDEQGLPSGKELIKFDGVLWTGSSLSVTDQCNDVIKQLNFLDHVFESGVPVYGSCWGMQLATVVAGGTVKKSSKGLEFGISKPIELTKAGRHSPYFLNRKENFSSLSIHFDEVVKLPDKAIILAKNSHSKVQAMEFVYKKSNFFGVQYHPEFRTQDMALIASFLSEKLVLHDVFESAVEVDKFSDQLMKQINLPIEISNYNLHSQEIGAWLETLAK